MNNVVSAFFSAAKSLGFSVVSRILKGVFVGLLCALVLTLALFYWGDSTLGLKYVFGILFFLISGALLSAWRVLSGLLSVVDEFVDSAVQGGVNQINGLMGDKQELLNPEAMFCRAKDMLSSKCPAVAPLLNMVSYQQFRSLVLKSDSGAKASALFGDAVGKVGESPNIITDMANALKLVWQVPVGLFIKKVLLAVAVLSAVVFCVRFMMV